MGIIDLTNQNYNQVVTGNDAVLVEFWAEWCQYCKQMKPILEEVSNEYEGKLTVAMVNAETEEKLASEMEVMSLPVLFIYKEGEMVGRVNGYVPKETLTNALDQLIG